MGFRIPIGYLFINSVERWSSNQQAGIGSRQQQSTEQQEKRRTNEREEELAGFLEAF